MCAIILELVMNKDEIYTDGSAYQAKSAGGWAANIMRGGDSRIISGYAKTSCNIRMELMALVKAAEAVEPEGAATIFTDVPELVKRAKAVMDGKPFPAKDGDLWAAFKEAARGKVISVAHLAPDQKVENPHHNAAHHAAKEAARSGMSPAGPPPSGTERVAFLREAGAVKRAHTYLHHGDDTIGNHTYNMLCLLDELNPQATLNTYKAILFHDAAERFTGDIPAPAKQSCPELKKAAKRMEHDIERHYRIDVPLTPEEKGWVKGVDKLEYLLWCEEQMALGNTYVRHRAKLMKDRIANDPDIPQEVKRFAAGRDAAHIISDDAGWAR